MDPEQAKRVVAVVDKMMIDGEGPARDYTILQAMALFTETASLRIAVSNLAAAIAFYESVIDDSTLNDTQREMLKEVRASVNEIASVWQGAELLDTDAILENSSEFQAKVDEFAEDVEEFLAGQGGEPQGEQPE